MMCYKEINQRAENIFERKFYSTNTYWMLPRVQTLWWFTVMGKQMQILALLFIDNAI